MPSLYGFGGGGVKSMSVPICDLVMDGNEWDLVLIDAFVAFVCIIYYRFHYRVWNMNY